MEKATFLSNNIFSNLKNLNEGDDDIFFFSEADFEVILDRSEQLGIGIYTIEPRLKEGDFSEVKTNEDYRKKATNPKWYKKAFFEFKKKQPNLEYSATYRVSEKYNTPHF